MKNGNHVSDNINKAIKSISSLISLSHSVKSFTVKWQLIRRKLEQLYCGITSIENLNSDFDPSLSTLITAILSSFKECPDIASRCFNVSFSGKLLMQIEFDFMSEKFERHVKNISLIYSSGALSHGFAIVVLKPSDKACRDDKRFYIRDLLTRMKDWGYGDEEASFDYVE